MRLTGLEKSQKGHQPAANTQHTDEQGKEDGGDDRRGRKSVKSGEGGEKSVRSGSHTSDTTKSHKL